MNTQQQLTGLELVKKLNAERTQGEWICYDNLSGFVEGYTLESNEIDIIHPQKLMRKCDAEYTALAVNNFADVVEALSNLVNTDKPNFNHLLEKAKQALNNIK
jgi:hypothetical protein